MRQTNGLESTIPTEADVRRQFVLAGRYTLEAAIAWSAQRVRVRWVTEAPGSLWLHWGVAHKRSSEWRLPAVKDRPAGSKVFDDRAVRSPFTRQGDGPARLTLELPAGVRAVNFVIYDAEADRWLKEDGADMRLVVRQNTADVDGQVAALIERIAEAEVGDHSWTLMHRFNLCHDLLDEVEGQAGAALARTLAVLFVWLRYSAIRQLTWQRNYNTQPRELAHAQDRLTRRLATVFKQGAEAAAVVRMMLSTLGRGGQGQAIRDQILHIMHRHGLKEAHGTWMEQWHQKLHNNTTPDDVVICQAYLAFLRSDGRVEEYDRVLNEEGIDRQRLASFERPITMDPPFYADRKDALIGEFEHFLALLRSVHSGTDLGSSLNAAQGCLDEGFRNWVWSLLHAYVADSGQLLDVVGPLTDARRQLQDRLKQAGDPAARRELLYVDLGIEEQIRRLVEGFEISRLGLEDLVKVMGRVVANVHLSWTDQEFALASKQWEAVAKRSFDDRLTVLEALSVVERLTRAVQGATDRLHGLVQPVAERLGRAMEVEPWVIPIFSEEVIRGSLLFVVSRALRRVDVLLRERAQIGGWQIVSPGQAVGRLKAVQTLRGVEDQRFDEPTIVLTDEIGGDEQIPEGVCGVVAKRPPDLVSHVAVRARNGRVVLAGCLEDEAYQKLRQRGGERVVIRSTAEGGLSLEHAEEQQEADIEPIRRAGGGEVLLRRVKLEPGVLGREAFAPDRVGAKTWHLAEVAESLPKWVKVPRGIALSFGMFEAALKRKENEQLARRYGRLVARVDDDPGQVLEQLRQTVMELRPWADLEQAVRAEGELAGLSIDADFANVFAAITGVWASKWTDRAYWSRRRAGIEHAALHIAVLIQEVVAADYAFVLHTVNPMTGDQGQVYGEVVAGLGQTLVGNEPGRAMGIVGPKDGKQKPHVVGFPSKSVALRGGGVICRSDSNGEDLPAYAGAGLYESVMVKQPKREAVDYTAERLVTDSKFRAEVMEKLTEIGKAVEQACGGAQDIEGVIAGRAYHLVQTRPQVGLQASASLSTNADDRDKK